MTIYTKSRDLVKMSGGLFTFTFIYLNRIAGFNAPAANHPGKDAFPRHDAIADQAADFTGGVAFLAYLRHLQEDLFAHLEPGADRQGGKLDAARGDVLGEIAIL